MEAEMCVIVDEGENRVIRKLLLSEPISIVPMGLVREYLLPVVVTCFGVVLSE